MRNIQSHRTLVIGVGSIGERHVRCLQLTGRSRVAICEPRQIVRERVAAKYGIDQAFASADDALTEDWTSVVIATPAHTHVPIARRVVEAGRPALIEKPLAVVDDGVLALSRAASASGLVVGVAYVYRAHPALKAMRDAIACGRFGEPLHLTATAGQHFPTYRPEFASTYYASHAAGGGAVQDALTHIFSAGEWLVGPITRIAADAAHRQLDGVDVEDTVNAMARHGEVLASYSLNQHQAPNEVTITVVCERGTARFELHRHAWRWMAKPDAPWQEELTAFESRDDWFTTQEHSWLDAVERLAPPLCSLEEGLQTLRANQATLRSIASGSGWAKIEPVEQEVAIARAR